MIKITLPKELTLKDSPFFEQILQASTRGDILTWNEDYSKATLTLSTNTFFSDEDAKLIVEKGGNVEGYPFWIKIKKADFESKQISKDLIEYLNIINIDNSASESSEINSLENVVLTYKDIFNFVREDKEDNNYIYFLNSANSEYLPMNLTFNL